MPTKPSAPGLLSISIAMLAVAALCLVGWRSMVEPPDSAGGTGFSSDAAYATLGELLREGRPHPVGSAENAQVRDRIVAALRQAGYQPEVRARFHCAAFGCSQLENILAVRAGTARGAAVLATAHYDSVPAGPGAADDGSGVAVLLELARALAKRPAPRNDVVLLFSDSEEYGLTGAFAFTEEPELAAVRAVVNLEARGAGGPSVMFETGAGNERLMALFADSVPYPVTNSLAFEIYKRLPNNTDFTAYRERGLVGFNLAFVGRASLYHTPHDDLAHLSRRTLQHHGDNAFALVGALADADLATVRGEHDASYFDLFGRVLVKWPAALNLPLALAGLAGLLVLLALRREELRIGAAAWSLALAALTPVALFAVGWLLAFPLGRWPGALQLEHPAPWPARVALVAAALACAVAIGALAAWRRAGWYAGWIVQAALALVLALAAPGAAYALLWPTLSFVALSFLLWPLARGAFWASAIAAAASALFWLGHMMMLESAVGFPQSAIKLAALAPLVWALTPVWARALSVPGARAVLPLTVLAIVTAAAAALAVLQPTSSPDCPRGLNVVYHADGQSAPRWTLQAIGPIDPSYLSSHGFSGASAQVPTIGGQPAQGPSRAATDLGLPAPSATGVVVRKDAGRTYVTAKVRFARESVLSGLVVDARAGLLGLSVDGKELWSPALLADGKPRALRLGGLGDRELEIELRLAADARGQVTVYQRLPLPDTPEARAMTAGRPADTMPFGPGDGALTVTRLWPR